MEAFPNTSLGPEMSNADNENNSQQQAVSWDDICVNPHELFLQQGRQQGHEAGLAQGYKDGYELGRTKAMEFGIELGFIRGCLVVFSQSSNLKRTERIDTHLEELRLAINEFSLAIQETCQDGNEWSVDILGKMQRIRAKFKLVTIQLRLPNFSLKQVMTDAAKANRVHKTTSEPNHAAASGGSQTVTTALSLTKKSSHVSSDW